MGQTSMRKHGSFQNSVNLIDKGTIIQNNIEDNKIKHEESSKLIVQQIKHLPTV